MRILLFYSGNRNFSEKCQAGIATGYGGGGIAELLGGDAAYAVGDFVDGADRPKVHHALAHRQCCAFKTLAAHEQLTRILLLCGVERTLAHR